MLELKKEQNDIFQALYVSKFPDDSEWLFSCLEQYDDKATLYNFDFVKWYDTYPEVAFIEHFLNTIDREQYRFVRAGEEPEDTEEDGDSDYYNLYIRREVSIHWE
jgi:hypothetical protein